MSYSRLTDAEKELKGKEIFASGEGMYFDDPNQSINSRYKRGLGGGLNNANSYESGVMPEGIFFGSGNRYPDPEEFDELFGSSGSAFAPSGLLFDGVLINDDGGTLDTSNDRLINYLSNSQDHSVATFNLVNSYIHYTPNPLGGIGELDQTAFYYNYDPLAGTPIDQQFYRYGKPT
tara:strand:+ start:100 stop:627 length:528 start_codon:yes stop_codon:yes gene_type:complete